MHDRMKEELNRYAAGHDCIHLYHSPHCISVNANINAFIFESRSVTFLAESESEDDQYKRGDMWTNRRILQSQGRIVP